MIKPLGKRTVIKIPAPERQTASGIILANEVKAKGEGEVMSTGSDLVKVGDYVLFSAYGPIEIKVDGVDYAVADDIHLVAILEK